MIDEGEVTNETVLGAPSTVLSRKAAGETVLLNLDSEEYYGLDLVGSRFWDLISSSVTFGEAVSVLLDEFDVERSTLEADLRSLLSEMAKSHLVVIDAA